MAILSYKLFVAKATGVSLTILLSACSSPPLNYSHPPVLKALNIPQGMNTIAPNHTYDIPTIAPTVEDKSMPLDLYPPVLPLPLLKDSQVRVTNNNSILLIGDNERYRNLWPQIILAIQKERWPIAMQDEANQSLTTDWITWPLLTIANQPVAGRYKISVEPVGHQIGIVVKSLALQKSELPATKKSASIPASSVTQIRQIQNHANIVLNTLTKNIEDMHLEAEKTDQTTAKNGEVYVLSGSDNSNSPLLLVNLPYARLWRLLPQALGKMGMKISAHEYLQGTINVTYNPKKVDWSDLGAREPDLKKADYKIQLGDLNGQSSLQFINADGSLLKREQNAALVAVLQAVFSHTPAVADQG